MPRRPHLGLLVPAGLLILVLGGCGDVAFHSAPVALAPLFGADGVRAHLVTLFGMLVAAAGLILRGAQRADAPPRKGTSHRHAHR